MKKLPPSQSNSVIKGLENIGLEYLAYLPDSTMKKIIDYFDHKKSTTLIPLAREEEGIGILAGLEACKKKAVLMIQDSGLGNLLNSMVTLGSLYKIPIFIVAVRRGGFQEYNVANAEFGEIATELVGASRSMGFILDYKVPLEKWAYVVEEAYNYAHFMTKPIILFINLKDESKL